jgi:ubiquinone/menaquinone biosynthesis C-methylase UbiE
MRYYAMKDANWLERWKNELMIHASSKPFLELGCGRGVDSQALTSYGFEVVSVDLRLDALGHCRSIEGCFSVNADISSKLPFRDNSFGLVLASLSLHYFSWSETKSIVEEIRRVLMKGGMLLVRVNSTEDLNFGAGTGEELEKNYRLVKGQKKRFFEKSDVELMLRGMKVTELHHETIDRYGKEKKVWVAHAAH